MKEPPLRTSYGGGSFVLRSAPERKVALLFCFAPCGDGGDVHFCEYSAVEGPCIPTSGKKRDFSMFSTNDGRGYGLTAFDLQGYSRSLAFIVAPEALGYVEYS